MKSITISVAALIAGLTLAGCGGSDGDISTDQAERQVNSMIQGELADSNAKDVYAGNASCKPIDPEQTWRCWVEIDRLNEEPVPVSGVLSCDGVKCHWRTETS